jgi:hypothetical protein
VPARHRGEDAGGHRRRGKRRAFLDLALALAEDRRHDIARKSIREITARVGVSVGVVHKTINSPAEDRQAKNESA